MPNCIIGLKSPSTSQTIHLAYEFDMATDEIKNYNQLNWIGPKPQPILTFGTRFR